MPGVHQVVVPPSALMGFRVGDSTGSLIPLLSADHWEAPSFVGLVPPNDTLNSESVVRVKHGDTGAVMGIKSTTSLVPSLQNILLFDHRFTPGS